MKDYYYQAIIPPLAITSKPDYSMVSPPAPQGCPQTSPKWPVLIVCLPTLTCSTHWGS